MSRRDQKKYAKALGIDLKSKLSQFLCPHKVDHQEWFVEDSAMTVGKPVYLICKDCGNLLDQKFVWSEESDE